MDLFPQKRRFFEQVATDQLNVQLSVHSKEKETVGLPAAPSSVAHQSSSPHHYLHLFQPLLPTGSSLFRRGWERRRRSSADERQTELLPVSREGRGGGIEVTTV